MTKAHGLACFEGWGGLVERRRILTYSAEESLQD